MKGFHTDECIRGIFATGFIPSYRLICPKPWPAGTSPSKAGELQSVYANLGVLLTSLMPGSSNYLHADIPKRLHGAGIVIYIWIIYPLVI